MIYIIRKIRNVARGFVQAYGSGKLKQALWNKEFEGGRWDCLDETPHDCVYPYIERYAGGASILDLGCGSGSTAIELALESYGDYTGVDISDVAIAKAIQRSSQVARNAKNRFVQSDIYTYLPSQRYRVILFRESIYYVPLNRIKSMLDRYSDYLEEGGHFVVRMLNEGHRVQTILDIMEENYNVVDRFFSEQPKAVVIVFGKKGVRSESFEDGRNATQLPHAPRGASKISPTKIGASF